MWGVVAAVSIGALGVAAGPPPLAAQELDRVDELVRDGRMAQAREAYLAWERGAERPSRAQRQRGLWLRALLTLDPAEAQTTLRRLAVEYPGGPFTDRALLRLGQAAELEGDVAAAEAYFQVLSRDYVDSPARDVAQAWLRAHAGTESGPVSGDLSVQLGAFSDASRARSLAQRAEAAGFQPRLVRVAGSGLVRVRVGRFDEEGAVERLRDRLREAGFESTLARDAGREIRVR